MLNLFSRSTERYFRLPRKGWAVTPLMGLRQVVGGGEAYSGGFQHSGGALAVCVFLLSFRGGIY